MTMSLIQFNNNSIQSNLSTNNSMMTSHHPDDLNDISNLVRILKLLNLYSNSSSNSIDPVANLTSNPFFISQLTKLINNFTNLTELLQKYSNSTDDYEINDSNYHEDDFLENVFEVKAFFYSLYIIIFMLGLIGNTLVCFVIIRNKSMHTVTNYFILNLALSDILLCIFAVPFTPLYLLVYQAWNFGTWLCHLVPFAQGVSVYISAFTLMSIAIDRFFVIIYPFKPRMKLYLCVLIIISIWLAAAFLTFPYGIFMKLIPGEFQSSNPDSTKKIMYCDEAWPYEESRKVFGLTTSILQFVVPFFIITYCYVKIGAKLSSRARARPGSVSHRTEELERERTRRTNSMLISMVIIFVVSWLPLNGYNLIDDFYMQLTTWKYSRSFFVLAHAVAMSSTCYNPFLYAWLNDNFRKEFKQILPCFRYQCRPVAVQPNVINEPTIKCNGHKHNEVDHQVNDDQIDQQQHYDQVNHNDKGTEIENITMKLSNETDDCKRHDIILKEENV